jgi:hypothetical protein
MPVVITAVVIVGYLIFHAGHGHANYRHARSAGHHRSPSLYIGARGPWISVPGPFGTRIGHRL